MTLRLLTAAAAFALVNPSSAAPRVTVEVNPRRVTVGDPVEVTLSAPVEEGASIVWPAPADFAPAEVLKVDTVHSGRDFRAVKYQVALFQPGSVELPSVPVIYLAAAGADTSRVPLGSVEVQSVLADEDTLSDLRDIRPPVKLAWTLRDLAPYLLAAAAIALLAVAAYWWWRRRRRMVGAEPVWSPPPLPPHVLALRRLDDLRVKRLWQNGFVKEYYVELTDILKDYIGGRYNIPAPEMTTAELLACPERWPTGDAGYRIVRRILTCGDLVKFARFKPDPHENDRNLETAYEFVSLTKPPETVEPKTLQGAGAS